MSSNSADQGESSPAALTGAHTGTRHQGQAFAPPVEPMARSCQGGEYPQETLITDNCGRLLRFDDNFEADESAVSSSVDIISHVRMRAHFLYSARLASSALLKQRKKIPVLELPWQFPLFDGPAAVGNTLPPSTSDIRRLCTTHRFNRVLTDRTCSAPFYKVSVSPKFLRRHARAWSP